MRQRSIWPALAPALFMLMVPATAQTGSDPRPGQVVVNGAVADEGGKAALLARVRELYGPERVVDQVAIAQVSLPPNWHGYLLKLIGDRKSVV